MIRKKTFIILFSIIQISSCYQAVMAVQTANVSSTVKTLIEWQEFFSENPDLVTLDANHSNLCDHLSGIRFPDTLRTLDVHGPVLNNAGLAIIAAYQNITSLHLGACQGITDFSPLANMQQLLLLNLAQTQVSDADLIHLRLLNNLICLSLERCTNVRNLSQLHNGVTSLKYLNVGSCTNLTELPPHEDMPNLEVINVIDLLRIQSFTNLLHYPKLRYVFMYNEERKGVIDTFQGIKFRCTRDIRHVTTQELMAAR